MRPGQGTDLVRLAGALAECGARLEAPGCDPAEQPRSADEHREVERVRRMLIHTAGDLSRHAAVTRRLDEEIDLLRARSHPHDRNHLTELTRRRSIATQRLQAELDAATRALLPGGDRLDPVTILRRLAGPPALPARRSYFGRPPVDRADRLRRLTSLLTGSHGGATAGLRPGPGIITVPSRGSRLARLRRRLIRPPHPTSPPPTDGTTGAASTTTEARP